MTQPMIFQAQLDALEEQAEQYLETFKAAYWRFTQTLITIKENHAWELSGAATFEQYLQTRWIPHLPFKSTGRIRQLEAAYSTMQLVADVTGIQLNENQVRVLKSVVPDADRHLMPEIVSRTFAYTSSPAKRHFQAVYDVLLERKRNAVVNVGGEDIPVDATQVAVLEAVLEADMRQREHIGSNGRWATVARYEAGKDGINVTGVTVEANQQVIIIVRELKADVTPVAEDSTE